MPSPNLEPKTRDGQSNKCKKRSILLRSDSTSFSFSYRGNSLNDAFRCGFVEIVFKQLGWKPGLKLFSLINLLSTNIHEILKATLGTQRPTKWKKLEAVDGAIFSLQYDRLVEHGGNMQFWCNVSCGTIWVCAHLKHRENKWLLALSLSFVRLGKTQSRIADGATAPWETQQSRWDRKLLSFW